MMRSLSGWALLLALSCGGLVVAPGPAHAQFEYCNDTSFFLFSALGRERGGEIRTEGWWLLRPGQCRTVVTTPLDTSTVYTYAESHAAHLGGIRTWAGRTRVCTGAGLFSIDDHSNCFDRGYEPREFTRVNIGDETQWTTHFTETENYDQARARLAGAQRLLSDVGYEPGSVDGYVGRRTRSAIREYKNDFDIDDDEIVSDALLDSLIAYASELQDDTGYQFCNQTGIELWAAMGYADGAEWQSFGWWSLAPGTCTKTLKDGLPAEQIYTYAVGYTPDGQALEWGGDYPLCAADQAFEISGTEDCESRGYMTIGFTRIDTEGRAGWRQNFELHGEDTINTFDMDDETAAGEGADEGVPSEEAP